MASSCIVGHLSLLCLTMIYVICVNHEAHRQATMETHTGMPQPASEEKPLLCLCLQIEPGLTQMLSHKQL